MRTTHVYSIWIVFTISLSFFPGCASSLREESREVRMRYVNLRAVMDYLASTDREALEIKKEGAHIKKTIGELEEKLTSGKAGIPEAVLRSDLRKYQSDLHALEGRESRLKADYYESIYRAIAVVSRRMNVDFVFNIGDDLIYSSRDYDITEVVLRELSGMKSRNAPQSR